MPNNNVKPSTTNGESDMNLSSSTNFRKNMTSSNLPYLLH